GAHVHTLTVKQQTGVRRADASAFLAAARQEARAAAAGWADPEQGQARALVAPGVGLAAVPAPEGARRRASVVWSCFILSPPRRLACSLKRAVSALHQRITRVIGHGRRVA